jgi:ribosomal protein S12 methylthiotransferase accessory factor
MPNGIFAAGHFSVFGQHPTDFYDMQPITSTERQMKKNILGLVDAPKGFSMDQDKIIPPAETLRRVKEKFKQLDLHILEQTIRVDTGRLDIPVFFSVCGTDAARLTGTTKQMGKGATSEQAEASAVMELVERFSFYSFARNPDNFIYDTWSNLKDRAISFDLIAASVHDASDDLAAAKEIFADLPMRWATGFDLTGDRELLIPFDWFFAINQFNGTSAGNCAEEALCQGICEIVERHVSAVVCREKRPLPGIDPESATDPVLRELIGKYKKNNIRLHVSDFTLDMGIPTVGVLAWDPITFPEKSEIVWTAGTAPCPQKAFSRALAETAQLAGDFIRASNYVASGLPKFSRIDDAAYVTHPPLLRGIAELPDISDANIKTEVFNCILALSNRKLSVFTIPTTHAGLGVPAFYTLVPGACFRERAAATSVGMFSCKLITETFDPAAALQKLQQANQRLPGSYYIQFYMGQCHLALDDPETAYRHFADALELNPDPQDIPSIYVYMSICRKDREDYPGALDLLKKGREWDAERTDIYNLMGFCHFKLKQHEKAIESFKEVIRLNPSSAIDYANIGSNYRDMGDMDNAAAYYRIALDIDPGIDFARENLEKLAGIQPDPMPRSDIGG